MGTSLRSIHFPPTIVALTDLNPRKCRISSRDYSVPVEPLINAPYGSYFELRKGQLEPIPKKPTIAAPAPELQGPLSLSTQPSYTS